MRVTLMPGEKVFIDYDGTDGSVEVSFTQDATEVRVNGKAVHLDPFVNLHDADEVETGYEVIEHVDMETYSSVPLCTAKREQDEWFCADCGLRWGVDESLPPSARCSGN